MKITINNENDGQRPLTSTWRHEHFLKSTCDMEPSDMRIKVTDTTWGISSNRHAILAGLRGDMGHHKLSDMGQNLSQISWFIFYHMPWLS